MSDTSGSSALLLDRSSVLPSSIADGPNQANPALLTRMSTSPASRASRSACAGSPRSAPTNRAEPPPFSIGDHRGAPIGVAAVHDHRGALRGQLCRGSLADSRRRAGDQRDLAFQIPNRDGACHDYS